MRIDWRRELQREHECPRCKKMAHGLDPRYPNRVCEACQADLREKGRQK